MPTVITHGVNSKQEPVSFSRTAGCFCILGKNSDYLGSLASLIAKKDFKECTTLEWVDIIPPSNRGSNILNEQALQYLFDRKEFMRTCLSSSEEILATRAAKFDIQNYPLNEVMHSMFWIRAFSGYLGRTSEIWGEGSEIQSMNPVFKAMCQLLPFSAGYYTKGGALPLIDGWAYGSDCNITEYDKMDFPRFVQICSGEYQKKHYEEGTYLENILEGENYAKNNSTYGRTSTSHISTPSSACKVLTRIAQGVKDHAWRTKRPVTGKSTLGLSYPVSGLTLSYPEFLKAFSEVGAYFVKKECDLQGVSYEGNFLAPYAGDERFKEPDVSCPDCLKGKK